MVGSAGQVREFLAFSLVGVVITLLYSVVFAVKEKNIFANVFKNVLFGGLSGCLFLYGCWRFVSFDMRFFHLLGVVAGCFLCTFLFKKTLDSIVVGLYNKIKKYAKGVFEKNATNGRKVKVFNGVRRCPSVCITSCIDYPYRAKRSTEIKRKKSS